MHGVVENFKKECFLHRDLNDKKLFEKYLKSRHSKFIDIETALNDNNGDVLTIDDATIASYEAALIANELGHKTTLFVNADNVLNNKTYFFCKLNNILERTISEYITFNGNKYPLKTFVQKKEFRKDFKQYFRTLSNIQDVEKLVDCLSIELLKENNINPYYLNSLSKNDIFDLIKQGVRIENHGFSHLEISSLNEDQFFNHITVCHDWLNKEFNLSSSIYAVPFGETIPKYEIADIKLILLASDVIKQGFFVSSKLYNRIELKF